MERVWHRIENNVDLYNLVWTTYALAVISIYFPKWIDFKLPIYVINQYSWNEALKGSDDWPFGLILCFLDASIGIMAG